MDFPDLAGAEVANHFFGILPGQLLATFQPGSAAQADTNIGTVRDFHRPLVAVEVSKNTARNAGKHRDGRIVGMDPDVHASFFGHWRHPFYEVCVVVPDLV